MNKKRERQIIEALFVFQGEKMPAEELDKICHDNSEKHFATKNLRGLGITLKQPYRSKAYGDRVNAEYKSKRDLEKELTIQRKRERQHKHLIRSTY